MAKTNPTPTNEQIIATNKVYQLRKIMTDDKLSEAMEMHKQTIYNKLQSNKWRDSEILKIEYLYNEQFRQFVDNLKILKQ